MREKQDGGHPSREVIERYTQAGSGLDEVTVWTVEAHLETCRSCRAHLAGTVHAATAPARIKNENVRTDDDSLAVMLQAVGTALAERIDSEPAPTPMAGPWARARRRWIVWSFLPWVLMTGLVLLAAFVLDWLAPEHPSLVLLVAPVAPLLGVAAAWNRRTDPAWELVAGSPRSGIWVLLRRTLGVLLLVIPPFMVASWAGANSPVVWLLPCLTLTIAALAAGARFGIHRAAAGIAVLWAVGVWVPALISQQVPVILTPVSLPFWAVLGMVAVAVVAVRADDYRHLASRQ